MKTGVVIVAGGKGLRMGGQIPKQFRFLGAKPVLAHTIEAFRKALPEAQIIVVLPEEHIPFWKDLCARLNIARHRVVMGGSERFHSVKNGIDSLEWDTDLIAIQDGVRPLGSVEMIRRVTEAAVLHGAAIPVVAAVDSYRTVEGATSHITDRSALRIVQTPQVFRAALLREAYKAPFSAEFTDDASVVEHAGHSVFLTEGERGNIKLTTPEDFVIAQALIEAREEQKREQDDENNL